MTLVRVHNSDAFWNEIRTKALAGGIEAKSVPAQNFGYDTLFYEEDVNLGLRLFAKLSMRDGEEAYFIASHTH